MATIRVPDEVPSAAQDSETLNQAFRGTFTIGFCIFVLCVVLSKQDVLSVFVGWGTDEKAIIRVLGKRNESQRRRIRESYREIYAKDLIDVLTSELSGDFMVLKH